MTVRNDIRTLAASLDSIRSDLGAGGELVIVDALSNDGTRELLEATARSDPRVTVVERACNRGIGRNLAVATSRAPIVLSQVDSDNRYAPGALSTVAAHVRDHADVGLAFTVGAGDRDPSQTRFYVWRREAFQRAGGYPDTQEREDPPLLLRALRAGFVVERFLLPRIADDLRPRTPGLATVTSPWRRSTHTLWAARKFRVMGFRYPEYVRLLWLTRRTAARFGAGIVLGCIAYLQGWLHHDGQAVLERDDHLVGKPAGNPAAAPEPGGSDRDDRPAG
jgi:glycosyltransferase involved in cell wall biosynthesis